MGRIDSFWGVSVLFLFCPPALQELATLPDRHPYLRRAVQYFPMERTTMSPRHAWCFATMAEIHWKRRSPMSLAIFRFRDCVQVIISCGCRLTDISTRKLMSI